MKKQWISPRAEGERFIANEYVAACWKINCNVPTGFGFIDNNGNGTYDNRDVRLTANGVSGCGEYHKGVSGVPGDGPVANAKWQPQRFSIRDGYVNYGNAYDVYHWRDGNGELDIHFSKVSDAEWETNPNAS